MAHVAIFVGSMYGNAEGLAEKIQSVLVTAGHEVNVYSSATIADLTAASNALFVSSTTGQGDIPDNLQPLFLQMQSQFPMMTGKLCGVIALGDSSYGDTYCGAGRQIDALLQELNATLPVKRLDVDACEYFEPWEAAETWVADWITHLS
ncbi:flavodoxin [Pseudoalteromonas xiamenensis]|uniref:flavodoxin n=1 Tax=Pseudoalteromonas xiamenensis TaxID=882626 RepID=UPI0027E5087B|nr:flavodoxin [Pseudoalteromonas xiamenensis]WMN59771.1 flavodoxin [Pseudoalteromonas xiamenensis]